ncbi:autotransporter outer membrane beta-barrel domain-containing protein [Desulfobacca acetoxidans]|uniref:Outer membrane autotransporter barrel domain protein n=1 Tax=Desulfobacca acetoxidans (strain ATCC 700848 / DSM 11109 / ASRB2) TaxID=880072 RepID=F2NED0_DESAR|nr:autotransporter outer membrane beta-barrel domain-containing protein [Desulfobacca acetoxidans]AEB08120.1 outer membrane autotransporter barrel domain protein [Desulfobacca acetoxidans DSM 11109]
MLSQDLSQEQGEARFKGNTAADLQAWAAAPGRKRRVGRQARGRWPAERLMGCLAAVFLALGAPLAMATPIAVVSEYYQGGTGGPGQTGGTPDKVSSVSPDGFLSSSKDIDAHYAIGIYGESLGGQGGGGTHGDFVNGDGGKGGDGGPGNSVQIKNLYRITTQPDQQIGIYASSGGGDGGGGGDAFWVNKTGGDGGKGGDAGAVTVINGEGGVITTTGQGAHGIFAQSKGGTGGAGGAGGGAHGKGGCGQGGGGGGPVTVTNAGDIIINDIEAYGIYAQSVGGFGGSGGLGHGIVGYGGDGNSGGDGNTVTVTNSGAIRTTGEADSDAIHAESIGGGGGSAGAAHGLVAIGGQGEAGGFGGDIIINNTGALWAYSKSRGIFAQSIGGGGGKAQSSVDGLVAIGGSSSIGGKAGQVQITNQADITACSNAIYAESIGGGGGCGTQAVGMVSIGGGGAGGGDGGAVSVTSAGNLATSQDNASAVLAKSTGGGGGSGGNSVGAGFWAGVAIGGKADKGGNAGPVTVNCDLGSSLTTTGHASHGVEAQSIGGGGGSGGYAVAGAIGDFLTTTVALGGSAGGGGAGNDVNVSSAANINTLGANADGILAQSTGGGGGSGGFGVAGNVGPGWQVSVGLGGSGGSGGSGGEVVVITTADKAITTAGNNSLGILAQSTGGGGGSGGFDVAANAGGISATVGLGGQGGSGGAGGPVQVDSGSAITTTGNNAHALLAQSVGGGGGTGGFNVSGGVSVGSAAVSLGGAGGDGGHGGQVTVNSAGDLSTAGDNAWGVSAQSVGGGGGAGGFSVAGNISGLFGASVSLGGSGGGGGSGGQVQATLSGDAISTQGQNSPAIGAQSVGGGGGAGGFSISGSVVTGTPEYPSFTANVSLGGNGGQGNSGGEVDVTSNVGAITTAGDHAQGIKAASTGGGGGSAGYSIAAGFSKNASLSFSLGGQGGDGNMGGPVSVESHSAITTSGAGSQGILAQSLGGGGGDGGFSVTGDFTYSGKSLDLGVAVGGSGGTGSHGSQVAVKSLGPTISTAGDGAAGVEARSQGGGGGDASFSGALSLGPTAFAFGFAKVPGLTLGNVGGGAGDGGEVSLENQSDVSTQGDAAEGLLAQSVGGGGGKGSFKLRGQVGFGEQGFQFKLGAQGSAGGGGGDAGPVTVNDHVAAGVTQKTIATSGHNSHGIAAQSIGGGGGKGGNAMQLGVTSQEGWFPQMNFVFGGAGGAGGAADEVSVTSDSGITTQGENASGILAQSVGGGGGDGGLAVGLSIKTQPTKLVLGALSVVKGGSGGSGDAAGLVTVESHGSEIATRGNSAAGIHAQSVGGGGGSGGGSYSGSFNYSGKDSGLAVSLALGGSGGSGGGSGGATVTCAGAISTGATQEQNFVSGNDSSGILAQSIGGGGGSGGYTVAGVFNLSKEKKNGSLALSFGAQGGEGNTAGEVSVTSTGAAIRTLGDRSWGIAAHSIGGGGGSGGFSVAAGVDLSPQLIGGDLSLSMGGDGGAGADAGAVTVQSSSSIATGWSDQAGIHGHDSPGIQALSLGGGGGSGGFSLVAGVSSGIDLDVSMGGKGGGSGKGGEVSISQGSGQISTLGDRSAGIDARSVGGGGGSGGFSIIGDLSVIGSLGASVGGSAGDGSDGGGVQISSGSSSIKTQGDDSPGITAQSAGGGGSSGGFIVVGAADVGGMEVGVGGTGGDGGQGGSITVTDTGKLIETAGNRSVGITAQSVGGGGGSGGFSVIGDVSSAGDVAVSLGSSGGSGGGAGTVNLASASSVNTQGDDSTGVMAQSVGGGGGDGGLSVIGNLSIVGNVNFSLGAQGGDGGQGSKVTINYGTGQISTLGDRSAGIIGQSVGGGGGGGGLSVSGAVSLSTLGVTLGGSAGSGSDGGEMQISSGSSIKTQGDHAPGLQAQSVGGGGGNAGVSVAGELSLAGLGIGIGADNGQGGQGGSITITDTGKLIETAGKQAPGLLAQSIGAGGGTAGFCFSQAGYIPFPIHCGGKNGVSGSGQAVTVQSSSSITTHNDNSPGLLAQSIGAGGGFAGADLAAGAPQSGDVTLGAENQAHGDAGPVQVKTTGTNITTAGKGAIGVAAQSIGGGGGLGWVTAPDNAGATGSLTLGGNNAGGSGGAVSLTNSSHVTVSGAGAHGLVAQSLGAGGGLGSTVAKGAAIHFGGDKNASGDGGEVTVTSTGAINLNNSIAACGLLAQSIGGGGGLVSHTSSEAPTPFSGGLTSWGNSSQGSGKNVTVTSSGNIDAGGQACIGIAAQSLGGGGGLNMSQGQGGSAGAYGDSGDVTVTQAGTMKLTGADSIGILAQSEAGRGTVGSVTVNVNGAVEVLGNSARGILAYAEGHIVQSPVNFTVAENASLVVGPASGKDPNSVALSINTNNNTNIENYGTITSAGNLLSINPVSPYSPCNFTNYGTLSSHGDLTWEYNGTFKLADGKQTIDGCLIMKPCGDYGQPPLYQLEKGELVTKGLRMDFGPVNFTQSGGTNTVNGDILIASDTGLEASFTLQDGQVNADNIRIANEFDYAAGVFTQSGGTNRVTGNLIIGLNQTCYGVYKLDGGRLQGDEPQVLPGGHFIKQKSAELEFDKLTIAQGGEFTGGGLVVGHIESSGLIRPGNSVGTLTIQGALVKNAGGRLAMEIASAGDYDRLAVTGTPGTLTVAADSMVGFTLLDGYCPRGNQVFPGIITASGGVQGVFQGVSNQQISPTLFWQPRYCANSMDLAVQRNYTHAGLGLNANQAAIGAMLNRLAGVTTGDLDTVLHTIDYLPDNTGVRQAFQQVSAEKSAALSNLALTGASFQMRQQAQRLTDLRFGPRGGGPAADGFGALRLNYSSLQGLMLAYNSASLAGLLTPRPGTAAEKPWGFYLYPSLVLGSQQSSLNQTGYNFNMAGFTTGADCWLGDNLVLGLATGYSHSDADFKGSGGNVATNTWPLTAYAAYLGRSWYTYGSLGYALNLFDLERNLAFGGLQRTAKSSPTGHQLNAYGEAGYDVKAKNLIITPMASLAYSGLWIDSYQESGAGALNLQVGGQSADSLQTGVGLKVAAPVKRAAFTLVPQVYASYQHEFANGSRGLNASLSQAGTTFAFRTDAAQRDFAVVGAKVDLVTRKNVQIGVNYNAEVGRGNSTAHSVYAGVRWQF